MKLTKENELCEVTLCSCEATL